MSTFELVDEPPKRRGPGRPRKRIPTHGGARPGAGRKPKDYEKPVAVRDYEDSRARNEASKADRSELAFAIESGEFVSRVAVSEASATAFSAASQAIRSIPDNLERKGFAPEICVRVGAVIDEVLEDLANTLEMFAGGEDDAD